jgi:DNA-binding FadR family transcriptional regulator
LQDRVHLGRISLVDLTEIRSILLTQAIHLACERGSAEDFDLLESNIKLTESMHEKERFEERRQAAIDFYRILAEAAGNPALTLLLESVNGVLRQFLAAASGGTTHNLIGFRRNMLKYLRARDTGKAATEMQKYLKLFHTQLTASLASIGGGPVGRTSSAMANSASKGAAAAKPRRAAAQKSLRRPG